MIAPAWAQGVPADATSFLQGPVVPMVMILAVIYFLVMRPQQQKAKEHREMLANLKRNDDVITAGGLYGKIVGLTDRIVTLEIAPNVKVRVDRPQIASLVKAGQPEEPKEKDKPK
jgi:preprotein translocase subunit YajC